MEKRRILAIIMAALMVIGLLPSMVFAAAPSGTLGGKLRIKGHAAVGTTLQADYGKAEPQGLSDDYVSFVWYREWSEGDLEELSRESKYKVTESDLGYKIVLEVTGQDSLGVSGTLQAKTLETAATAEEAQALADQKTAEGVEIDTIPAKEEAEEILIEEIPADVFEEEIVEEFPTEEVVEVFPEEIPDAPAEGNSEAVTPDEPENMETEDSELDITISEEWNSEGEASEGEAPVYAAEAIIESESGIVEFGNVEIGKEADAAKYVTIRNTGNRTLNFQGISPEYFMVKDITNPLEPGAEAEVWIQPRAGQNAGEYTGSITYVTDEGAEVAFQAQMVLDAAPQEEVPPTEAPEEPTEAPEEPTEAPVEYAITTDLDAVIFGDLTVGYETISDYQAVTVTNAGETPVTLKLPETEFFDAFIMADGEEDPRPYLEKGQSVGFLVQPKFGLAEGNYSEKIVFGIEESEEVTKTVTAEVVVKAAEQSVVSVKAEPSEIAFDKLEDGYTETAATTVTLTNDGNTDLVLEQPLAENFNIGALSAEELAVGESVTFTVQPVMGLTEGTYVETIQVWGHPKAEEAEPVPEADDVIDVELEPLAAVEASVTVEKKVEIINKLTVAPDYLDFGEIEAGYEDAPKSQKVTVINKGNTTVTLEKPVSDYFRIGSLSDEILEPGETCTFAIRPKNGLEESTYIETILIPNDADIEAKVDAEFTVTVKSIELLGIQKPADIKGLKHGVPKSSKGLGLPTTVVIKTSEGKMKAKVRWNIDDAAYDPKVKEAQNFKVNGKVILPEEVTNPNGVDLTFAVNVAVKAAYIPKVPDASENKITGISYDGYTTQSKITFEAVGAGMENTSPREGDVRFQPLKWKVINTNSWDGAPYTATFGITKAGTYTLKVMFDRQKFDGKDWVSTGENDTKQVEFTIDQGVEITPTPSAQQKEADKKSAVETGDTTAILPFVIILLVAVLCIAGIVVYKKKRK